jgi:peptide/nickel transport system permease protein
MNPGRIPLGVLVAGAATALVILVVILAPWIAPYGEHDFSGGVWEASSTAHWFGTDNLGRDLFTRLLYGGRNTIGVAAATTAFALMLGTALGLTAANAGGWLDNLLSRCVDILLSVPVLISALMVLSVLGSSVPVLMATIGVLESSRVYLVARSVARAVVLQDFVAVARLRGEGAGWIVWREILPNVLPPLMAEGGLRFSFILLFTAALGFLGLGIQPPATDWGSMVRENAQAIYFARYAPLYPAATIALLTLGINLTVDWLSARKLHDR